MKKRIALVTGSTRGIGKQIALDFLKEGYFVIINGREDIIDQLDVFNDYKDMFEYYKFDITNRESVKYYIKEIANKYGKIDILVNNAGITRDKTLLKLDYDMWDKVIDINLTGVFNLCKEVVPLMRENKFGRIINISSVVGLSGSFGQTNYTASKAGVIGFSKSLALELAKYGITVNSIAPGYIETEMTNKMPMEVIEKVKSKIPVGEFGKPEDVSNVVKFLAKEESRYITGETISVNGGIYLK